MSSYILLLPNEAKEPPISSTRAMLNRGLDTKIPMSMQKVENIERKEDQDNNYSEFVLRLQCDFSQVNPDWLVDRFSENNLFADLGESWLSFTPYFDSSKVKANHRHVTLLNFGLGSLIGFNNYVEHFAACWSKDSQPKQITQLSVRFEHHIMKLQIFFIVADRNFKVKREMDGRSHRLHCLEILYNMIKRIIIVKKYKTKDTKPRFDLYLQVIASPILKKLEQKKNPQKRMNEKFARYSVEQVGYIPEDDSFSYVSPEFHSPETPYMRCVDFGNEYDSSEEEVSEENMFTKGACYLNKNNFVDTNELTKTSKKQGKKANVKKGNSQVSSKENGCNGKNENVKNINLAYCNSKVLGMSRVLKLELTGDDSFEAIEQLVASCSESTQVFFSSMQCKIVKTETPNPGLSSNNFECLYALKCLLSFSFQISDELWLRNENSVVSKKLELYRKECPEALSQTLYNIYNQLGDGNVIRFHRALELIYQKHSLEIKSNYGIKSIPSEMIMMKRAILTPTRFYFVPPVIQMKSFLLRSCDPEYAMRVTVRDDNLDQMTFTICGKTENKLNFLNKYIGEKLRKGFSIGKRHYEFFGSSSSQLREHGCFFFAKDSEGRTAEDLRLSVGDIHTINNVPKFMARLGQSLSQSMANVHVPLEWVQGPVPDEIIEKNGKKYNFTDGIGKMSPAIAEMMYAAMHLEPDDKPCAAQIRYGGCKGMLAVDPTLEGKTVILRESQWKFPSKKESLEILKLSRPQKAFLNRPFITILEQLGVPCDVFIDLQQKEFSLLIGSLIDSRDAARVLNDRASLRLPYQKLHQCGFDLASEPFFQPILFSLYRNAISLLKHKARILIPFDKSRTMLGVVDETKTLEYGQVFFQYSNVTVDGKVSRTSTIYTGTVLVTKNPCMHPGDVRKFEAVDIKALHHLKDVLVFPCKGKRPHPDEMAGSDLDGDEYCVIWYEPLFFHGQNRKAMDYSSDAKPPENNSISVADMTQFMCRYMLDDCVGLIASAHLAWADLIGIFHPTCMTIAKKYSVSLDFAKSGTPEVLTSREKVSLYPDFMEKNKEKRTYLSVNALGELFRNCKRIELVSEILTDDHVVTVDPDLIYPGWEEYKSDAEDALMQYKHLLFTTLKTLNTSNEGEIMSGVIKKIEKTFMGKNVAENVERALTCIIPRVFRKMRAHFLKEFQDKMQTKSGNSGTDDLSSYISTNLNDYCRDGFVSAEQLLKQMFKKISAWYQVAYEDRTEIGALGLPWTLSELMGLLKANGRLLKEKTVSHTVVEANAENFINDIIHQLNLPEAQANIKPGVNHFMLKNMLQDEHITEALKAKIVLRIWIENNSDIVTLRGITLNNIMSTVSVRFDQFSRMYLEDNPGATSGQMIVAFIRKTSSHCGFSVNDTEDYEATSVDKDLAVLSIVALSNLITKGKMWEDDFKKENILFREFRETIRFPVELGRTSKKGQMIEDTTTRAVFRELITRYEIEVKKTLKQWAKLKSIDIECLEMWNDSWYVTLTAYGKISSIELLKDFMVQINFVNMLAKRVQDSFGIILESKTRKPRC